MNDTTKVRKLHKPMQPCLDVTAGQLKLSKSHVDNHSCRLLQTEPLYRAVYVVFSCFKHKRLLLRFLLTFSAVKWPLTTLSFATSIIMQHTRDPSNSQFLLIFPFVSSACNDVLLSWYATFFCLADCIAFFYTVLCELKYINITKRYNMQEMNAFVATETVINLIIGLRSNLRQD